jgi:hypothetical protein
MKQKLFVLGLITIVIIFTGLVFKINHLAGAYITLFAGVVAFLFLFLPLALINNYKAGDNRHFLPLYVVTWMTCVVLFGSGLFKIMHWQYAAMFLLVAIPFPYVVFLPVFIYLTSRSKTFNIYNTVFVLFLLVISSVLSALLALNVSKERISDSYNISGNYIKARTAFCNLQTDRPASHLVIKINDLLGTINGYRGIILKDEGITTDQWEKEQVHFPGTEPRHISARTVRSTGITVNSFKLEDDLWSLVNEMHDSPGFEGLAKIAPGLFDLKSKEGNGLSGVAVNVTENNIPWVLIYLDGLETNLKMIKALAIRDRQ